MVLNKYLLSMVLVYSLAGCSVLTNTGQQPQDVIPAYTDPDENQEDVQHLERNEVPVEVIKMNDKRPTTSNSSAKKSTTAPAEVKASPPKNTSTLPYPLIVQSLIARAEKAVAMQQWLRAQHILEQGLHIAPNNAKVFLIYGDVYFNLGILAQAEQMYRRSIALAGDDSPIGRSAKNKLEALKIGN
jgi:tetratricopeptide (TPR) repeat protein